MHRFTNVVQSGWLVSFAVYTIVPLIVFALDSTIFSGLRDAYPWEVHRDVLGSFVWVLWIAGSLSQIFAYRVPYGSYAWSVLFAAWMLLCYYVVMLFIVKVSNSGYVGMNPSWGDVFTPLLFIMLPLMLPELIGLFLALWWIESAINRDMGTLLRIAELFLAISIGMFSLGSLAKRTTHGFLLDWPSEMSLAVSNGLYGFAALSFSMGAILFLVILILGLFADEAS